MNILPHKSWHVRTKKNIARVRRDEEKAAKEEEERLRRVNLAEHEARIEVLRTKRGLADEPASKNAARKGDGGDHQQTEKFSLFENYQDTGGRDAEKEAEEKAEQEKWEVKTGIFSYIDGRYKHENEDQWYLKAPGDLRNRGQSQPQQPSTYSKEEAILDLKDERAKQRLDPLLEIKRNLAQMERRDGGASSSSSAPSTTSNNNQTTMKIKQEIKTEPDDNHHDHHHHHHHNSETKRHKTKKNKKEKSSKHKKSQRKSKKRKHHHSSDSDSDDDDKAAVMTREREAEREALTQRLRLERLERERKERLRTQQLLQGPQPQPLPNPAIAANQQRYNSQFNPHIARQNQPQQQ